MHSAWTHSHIKPRPPAHLLGLVYEMIRLVPVSQEVSRLLIIHPDVVISKQAREKVIYFPGHVQNVVNAAENKKKNRVELPRPGKGNWCTLWISWFLPSTTAGFTVSLGRMKARIDLLFHIIQINQGCRIFVSVCPALTSRQRTSRCPHHRSEALTRWLIHLLKDVQTSVPKDSKLNIFSHAVEQSFSVSHIRGGACLGKTANIIRKILTHLKSLKINQAKKWCGDDSVVKDSPAAACPGRWGGDCSSTANSAPFRWSFSWMLHCNIRSSAACRNLHLMSASYLAATHWEGG